MKVAPLNALLSLFTGPFPKNVGRVMMGNELKSCFGSFWRLFNRLKNGSADVVAILDAGVSESEARQVFPSVTVIPWERGPEVRSRIRRAFNPEFPANDLVFLVPYGCSDEEAIRTLRLISSVPELSESLRRRRTKVHVWRLGPKRVFRVYDPEKQNFVCPLATI